ncbi:hypothetical protein NEIRO03_0362 [Nematocida sp. AWRm78]|nr:hypothetical protein NEIRO02_0394 [Nematocida sp. AWRm79]KAI5182711.1 hypothetical protein NEIRO03_0362 [Nematocida sp. AWRm78]
MLTRFGKMILQVLHSITPEERIENINIWRYSAPNRLLSWQTHGGTGIFKIGTDDSDNPLCSFQIRYFPQPQENPVKNALPVNIWTRGRQSLGLCGLTIQSILYKDASNCTDQWIFAQRPLGGFYIKPYNDQTLCINNFDGSQIRVETCRPDFPTMAFMYGTPSMRIRFLFLNKLLNMNINNNYKLKEDINHIISTGAYMYDPDSIETIFSHKDVPIHGINKQALVSTLSPFAHKIKEENPSAVQNTSIEQSTSHVLNSTIDKKEVVPQEPISRMTPLPPVTPVAMHSPYPPRHLLGPRGGIRLSNAVYEAQDLLRERSPYFSLRRTLNKFD